MNPTITFYSLSDYNNGLLISREFDLTQFANLDDLHEAISEWLADVTSNMMQDDEIREEWIVADAEDVPSRYLGTYDLDPEFFEFLEVCNALDSSIVMAGVDAGIPLDSIEEAYRGHYESDTELAYNFVDETGMLDNMPETIKCYFDFEAFGRDLAMDYVESDGHYFLASY